jgi:hypothetical protein
VASNHEISTAAASSGRCGQNKHQRISVKLRAEPAGSWSWRPLVPVMASNFKSATSTGSPDAPLVRHQPAPHPEALLQLVSARWSIQCWHWIRDPQLQEDAHRYRGTGAVASATFLTAALNLLQLAGFQSIRTGMQTVCTTSQRFWRWSSAGHGPTLAKTSNQPCLETRGIEPSTTAAERAPLGDSAEDQSRCPISHRCRMPPAHAHGHYHSQAARPRCLAVSLTGLDRPSTR